MKLPNLYISFFIFTYGYYLCFIPVTCKSFHKSTAWPPVELTVCNLDTYCYYHAGSLCINILTIGLYFLMQRIRGCCELCCQTLLSRTIKNSSTILSMWHPCIVSVCVIIGVIYPYMAAFTPYDPRSGKDFEYFCKLSCFLSGKFCLR